MPNVSATEIDIAEMTTAIVEAVRPRMVLLIGSWAQGTERTESDIDFLVISNAAFTASESRSAITNTIRKVLRKFRVAKDIILVSPEELEFWRSSPNHIIGRGLKSGKVLYAR